MNNSLIKSLILALAIAIAVGGVLFFIQTVASPPQDIKATDVHSSDLQQFAKSYNPDSLGFIKAERMFDVIIDRATIYKGDSFIDEKTYDDAVANSAEKFSATFIKWAMSKFWQSVWNHSDHVVMTKIIKKLRNVRIAQGTKKALESKSLTSLTKIESIIGEYENAWKVAKQTTFINFDDAFAKRRKAESLARKEYLRNCRSLVAALQSVGKKLEESSYGQLKHKVENLYNFHSFGSKTAYDNESSRIFDLIQSFEKTQAFGVSTSSHAAMLKALQDYYDRAAEYHNWPE